METSTAPQLTKEEKAILLGMYMFKEVEYQGKNGRLRNDSNFDLDDYNFTGKVSGIEYLHNIVYIDTYSNDYTEVAIDDVKVIVKDIYNISNKYAAEIAKMFGYEKAIIDKTDDDYSIPLEEIGKQIIYGTILNKLYKGVGRALSGIKPYYLRQYLISLGVDVPIWLGVDHWANGKTLMELGMAVLHSDANYYLVKETEWQRKERIARENIDPETGERSH